MPRYQLPSGNIIIADAAFIAATCPGAQLLVDPVVVLPPTPISVQDFRDRFTNAEKAAIHGAALSSGAMAAWLADLAAAPFVRLDNAKTIAGINALVSANLLTQQRATVILTP